MNTTEKNKLIAEFLQVDKNENGTFELPQYGTIRLNGDFKTEFIAENLQYHKDWNWLMEVVEKIENDINGLSIYYLEIFKSPTNKNQVCRIYSKDGKQQVNEYAETKIQAVYNTCVEFIKWYNQQN